MFKRRVGNRKGNAMIEFALVLPLLLSILGGVTDFGLIFFVSHTVQNAAREGARLAVTLDFDTGTAASTAEARVRERMPSTGLFANFNTVFVNRNDCDVSVRVEGDVPFFFLRILPGFAEPRHIAREVTMRYERCGDNAPPVTS